MLFAGFWEAKQVVELISKDKQKITSIFHMFLMKKTLSETTYRDFSNFKRHKRDARAPRN